MGLVAKQSKFSAVENEDDDEHEARFNIDNYFFKVLAKRLL